MCAVLLCAISVMLVMMVANRRGPNAGCKCRSEFFDERGVLEGRRDAPVRCYLLLPIGGFKIPLSMYGISVVMSAGVLLMLIGTLLYVAPKDRDAHNRVNGTVAKPVGLISTSAEYFLCKRFAVMVYALGMFFVIFGVVMLIALKSAQGDDGDAVMVSQVGFDSNSEMKDGVEGSL